MRSFSFRNVVGRPALAASRAAQTHCWQKGMCSTTAVAPPPLNVDADKKTERGVPCGNPRQREEWRPSEAHKASATSLRRNKVAQAKASVATQVFAGDGLEATSPGLRRRELLGGGRDVPTQELASTPETSRREAGGNPLPGPGLSALLTTASGEYSVASSSATQKFRARRELERLAAAGSTEAAESIRMSGLTSLSPAAVSSSTAEGSASGASSSERPSSGAGATPLTVLPFLLLLVAAGYCAASDILPREWLSWLGGSSGEGAAGAAGSERRDSRIAAKSKGYHGEHGGHGSGGVAGENRGRVRGRGKGDASAENGHQPWQKQPSATSSSQVLRRLSRAAATSPPPPTPASTLATSVEVPDPADPSVERHRHGNSESVEDSVVRVANDHATSGERNVGDVPRWWGGGVLGSTPPQVRGRAEVSVGR